MSTRPQIKPIQVLPSPQGSPVNSGDMTLSLTSAPTIISNISKASYAVSWSGTTPVGTISIQVSNDFSLNPNGSVNNAGTWTTLTLEYNGSAVTTVPVSGNTGSGFIDIDSLSAYAIRLIYTPGSGSGELVAILVGKVA